MIPSPHIMGLLAAGILGGMSAAGWTINVVGYFSSVGLISVVLE
jgi:hypothetical protein